MAGIQAVRDLGARLMASELMRDLMRPGNPFRSATKLRIEDPWAEDLGPVERMAMSCQSAKVDFVLPSSAFLVRELQLPRMVAAKATSAIAVNLRQTLPGGARGLDWRHIRKRRTQDGDLYTIYIAKEAALARLKAAGERAGIRALRILAEETGTSPFVDTLYERSISVFWQRATGAILASLLIFSVATPLLRARNIENANAIRAQETAALQEEAVAARSAADTIEKGLLAGRADIALLARDRKPLEILGSLAAVLGDETWAPEVTLSDGHIYLALLTKGKVPDILEELDGLEWVEAARLDGPIIPDSLTGQSRFQVVMDMPGVGLDE